MKLIGSCHCQAITFSVNSHHFYPYQLCYCSICRKTQGGGGYAINLSGEAKSLKIKGAEHLSVYRAKIKNPEDKRAIKSTAERNFCSLCGSALWLYSPEWPELVHPFASAIDTPLPVAPEKTHCLTEFRANWVPLHKDKKDKVFKRYPKESIAEWHQRVIGDEKI